ncbi:terpenoid synthase 25-like [Dorcoceras hygrometricum]|uniref:Terpenoid synthase 25-like n=1 Tax=Dorcoceras hygrometricum TaxID=472368 RepID=A0A2Z7C3L9_9LAMI|nr:terpenoid synthase 25-like [Dorcoceras hygrometricum]
MTVKAGSFDAVTHERFVLMTAIHFELKQTSKITDIEEDSVKNKETDIKLVETEILKEIDPDPVADVGQIPLDEESLSIDDLLKRIPRDMMLSSVTATEPTKIKFGHGITITGVTEGDWYKASLPKIVVDDKGKAPLVELDTIKGHPDREMFQLICGDIEFLIQLRVKVIDEVAKFFNSFSLRRLAVLKSVINIAAQEEHVLTWAETDSVQVALQRRLYIVAKYRELLLRKFLEAHRANFSFGQPWSAMALQIIDLLSAAHSTFVKDLLTQKQRTQATVDKAVLLTVVRTQCLRNSTPPPVKAWGWYRVFTEILQYYMFGCLNPVGSFNPCTTLVPVGPVLGDRSIPRRIVDNISYHIQIVDSISFTSIDLGIADPVVQEQFATLRDNLAELIAFFNRVCYDKKGEVGSSRAQPPPDDRSRPGGGGRSRSEPVKRRGSGSQSGPRRRGFGYCYRDSSSDLRAFRFESKATVTDLVFKSRRTLKFKLF